MSLQNNIIIVAENAKSAKEFQKKLVLLRDIDAVTVASYSQAVGCFDKSVPDCIIMFSDGFEQEVLELVKRVRNDYVLKHIPIVVVASSFEQEFAVAAFDEGITEFVQDTISEAELLMRIIWALQRNDMMRTIENRRELLEQLDVIEKDTGIFSPEFTEKVFEGEIKEVFKYKTYAALVVLAPDVDSKNKISPTLLSSIIKKCTRNSDVVGKAEDGKFYILLPKTKAEGVLTVYDRIKKHLTTGMGVCVGAAEISKKVDYEKIMEQTMKALYEALAQGSSIVFVDGYEPTKQGSWLEKVNAPKKDFKLFKQAFAKKLDSVITPVFYQVQKDYVKKLHNTEIEQVTTETESMFSLRSGNFESVLTLTYSGFAKINIHIVNNFEFKQSEAAVILELNELNASKVTEILEKMIFEFKARTNG